jgi:protein tyrosine phosphatase
MGPAIELTIRTVVRPYNLRSYSISCLQNPEFGRIIGLRFRTYSWACTRHVINSTKDVPTFNVPGIQTTRINVDDHPYARLDAHFDRVADAISHVCSRGGKVLVHCVVGVSRSATLCIVYLMKYHKLTLVQAHEYVRNRCWVIAVAPQR